MSMICDRHVAQMEMERYVPPSGLNQRALDEGQMSDWVNWLAPWQVIATLTWKDWLDDRGDAHGVSVDAARRRFERFMSRELPRLSYFYAVEPNPSREGSHVHALWCDCQGLETKLVGGRELVRSVRGAKGPVDVWNRWHDQSGRCSIERVRSHEDVTSYCAKHLASTYTTKAAVWWNVKLQWHRLRAMHGDFQLRPVVAL